MTAEQSHRFVLTGQDPEGGNRTIILWVRHEALLCPDGGERPSISLPS